MPDVEISLGPVLVDLVSLVRGETLQPLLADPEVTRNLVPHRMTSVELDQYRTRLGWPVEVPRVDSLTQTLASCTGELLSQRPDPTEIETGAIARWIAGDTFDAERGSWVPSEGAATTYRWRSTPDYTPTLISSMPYFVGKELFLRDAINFDADGQQHMWSEFTGGLVGTAGYTVVMVALLNSAYGNTPGREFMGVWAPGTVPLGEDWSETEEGFEVRVEAGKAMVSSPAVRGTTGLNVTDLLAAGRPVYLAFSLGYPIATLWGSLGPGRTTSFQTPTGDLTASQQLDVALGRSTGSILNTADMSVFDLSVYPDVLGFEEIEQKISLLAGSYGG